MRRACFAVGTLLILVSVAVAGVDFSGTWAYNESKSDQAPAGRGGRGGGMAMRDLTIKQTDNVMTVVRTMGQNTRETAYTMDGAEHTASAGMGELKYKAVLSGNSVHITGSQTSQRGERQIDQTYMLSDDGKTLTVTSVNQGQNGATTRKTVYDKK
jgi:hypothetical protein